MSNAVRAELYRSTESPLTNGGGGCAMSFKHGYQAGRVVGEHYLDYLIGFQIGFWMSVPLAIMKQMYSQPTLVKHAGIETQRTQ